MGRYYCTVLDGCFGRLYASGLAFIVSDTFGFMAVHSPATWDSSGAMCFLGWVGVGSRVSASLNLTNGGGSWVSASLNMTNEGGSHVSASLNMTEGGGKFKIGDMVDKIMAVSSK
mgnify:CR=1 FL=1